MKESKINPDDAPLSSLLGSARPAPALPPRFRQNVWRRIEDAEAPAKSESWLDGFAALILRPRFAYATAAILLLAGGLAGTLEGRHLAQHEAQINYLTSVAPHAAR